mgnify:CR=1 FL=1
MGERVARGRSPGDAGRDDREAGGFEPAGRSPKRRRHPFQVIPAFHRSAGSKTGISKGKRYRVKLRNPRKSLFFNYLELKRQFFAGVRMRGCGSSYAWTTVDSGPKLLIPKGLHRGSSYAWITSEFPTLVHLPRGSSYASMRQLQHSHQSFLKL